MRPNLVYPAPQYCPSEDCLRVKLESAVEPDLLTAEGFESRRYVSNAL